jgi:hypothetical protein
VKKISAIFFFTVYLLSTTEAHQLLKLPVIFEHFSEHQQENNNITALEFLSIHYLHGSPKDKDYDRDMQLPFKTSNDCIASISPAFIPLMIQAAVLDCIEIVSEKKFIHKGQFVSASYPANIWQPPKTC